MARRHTPSRGSKPDKLIRDALILELRGSAADAYGRMRPRLRQVASRLVRNAIDGDMKAIREICDRVDGKVMQPVVGVGHAGALVEEDESHADAIEDHAGAGVAADPQAEPVSGSGG